MKRQLSFRFLFHTNVSDAFRDILHCQSLSITQVLPVSPSQSRLNVRYVRLKSIKSTLQLANRRLYLEEKIYHRVYQK
jgi:hypothetical protein